MDKVSGGEDSSMSDIKTACFVFVIIFSAYLNNH